MYGDSVALFLLCFRFPRSRAVFDFVAGRKWAYYYSSGWDSIKKDETSPNHVRYGTAITRFPVHNDDCSCE